MTKKKRKYHKYEDGEIVYRQWFPAETLLKDFLKVDSAYERVRFINRIRYKSRKID